MAATTASQVLTDPAAAEKSRQRTEDQLNDVLSRAMRKYLARVQKELDRRGNAGVTVLTAAGEPLDPITLGTMAGWWADTVDEEIITAVAEAWRQAYGAAAGQIPESALRDSVETYLPRVRDRLVRGIVPPIADDSFDKARTLLARSAAEGWTRQETAQRVATTFGWETNGPALRTQLDATNARIEQILDPYGHPGTPAREYARLHDPVVAQLQGERADIVKQLDAEQSYWQTRAERIARTESTALHSHAADRALQAEGFTHKTWISTEDARTRQEHRDADGQTVPVDGKFIIGGYTAQFPADPSLPPHLSINCRCCIVAAEQEKPAPAETIEPPKASRVADEPPAPLTQAGDGGSSGGGIAQLRGRPADDGDWDRLLAHAWARHGPESLSHSTKLPSGTTPEQFNAVVRQIANMQRVVAALGAVDQTLRRQLDRGEVALLEEGAHHTNLYAVIGGIRYVLRFGTRPGGRSSTAHPLDGPGVRRRTTRNREVVYLNLPSGTVRVVGWNAPKRR